MSDFYLGEIRLFAFPFAPTMWHKCDGTNLPITQNQALFSLISNRFGGNGTTNFNLPDLRGRTPVHVNATQSDTRILTGVLGTAGGTDSVVLTSTQVPDHTHALMADAETGDFVRAATPTVKGVPSVAGAPSGGTPQPIYVPAAQAGTLQALDPTAISAIGAAVPHENRQPYVAANYCIAVSGYYPPHND